MSNHSYLMVSPTQASDDAALMKFELAQLAHEAVHIDPHHPITIKHHEMLRKMPDY